MWWLRPANVSRWVGVQVLLLLVVMLVVPSSAAASDPSRDGRIAFKGDAGISLMDSDGSNLKNVTMNSRDNYPLWSPDGTRLAFISDRDEQPGASGVDIYIVDVSSGQIDRVTWDATGGPPSSWSPNGESIVYVSNSDGNIYRVGVADGASTRIATRDDAVSNPETSFESPTFSPDGSRIAYVERSLAWVPTGGWPPRPIALYTGAIFVTNLDGSSSTRITNTPAPTGSLTNWVDNDEFPVWSPDGTRLAFSSDRGSDNFTDLFVINADGTGRRQLTDGTEKVLFPAWSPDGAKIAWSGDEFSYVADVDGTNKITLGDISTGEPSWSSDGMHIALEKVFGVATVHRDGSNFTVLEPDGLLSYSVERGPYWQPVFPPVGIVDSGTGVWRLRDWGGKVAEFYYGNPGDVPFVGDWDCDGVETPGLYRQSDGYAYLRNTNTQGIADIKFYFGNPGDIPLAGDFNGDGCDTLALYRPSEQVFYIVNTLGSNNGGLGAADYSFVFGNPGDKPVVGDWDGDGIDEVGLHRESVGMFYWRNTLTTGIADGSILFGDAGDRFVSGDWGRGPVDGVDTPAVYRPSDTTFYFRYTLTQGVADTQFTWTGAGAGWIPIAGNFDLK